MTELSERGAGLGGVLAPGKEVTLQMFVDTAPAGATSGKVEVEPAAGKIDPDEKCNSETAKGMKKLKLTWSCNARAHLDYETLRQLRDNGLRLLLVLLEEAGVAAEVAACLGELCRGGQEQAAGGDAEAEVEEIASVSVVHGRPLS